MLTLLQPVDTQRTIIEQLQIYATEDLVQDTLVLDQFNQLGHMMNEQGYLRFDLRIALDWECSTIELVVRTYPN